MKYPEKQYEVLKNSVIEFNKYFDVKNMNLYDLHFKIYQQFSKGQEHNRLIVKNGQIKRQFSLINGELVKNEGEFIIKNEFDFELYPEGCNDNHIYTAIKNAVKNC